MEALFINKNKINYSIIVQFHNVIVFNIKSKLLCFAKLHKEV